MLNFAYCSDKYQYTMGKSFYDSGMKDQHAVFNLFYRKAPDFWGTWGGAFRNKDLLSGSKKQGNLHRRILT